MEQHNHKEEYHAGNHGYAPDNIPHDEYTDESESKGSLFVRVAVILGILIILFFISISIVRFVPKLFSSSANGTSSFFSGLFSTKAKLEIGVNKKEIRSGETFVINWKNTGSDKEGIYSWSFKCTEGIKVEYQSTSGALKPVVCETIFPLPANTNSYPFTVTSSKKESVSVPMNVTLWDKETNKSKLSVSSNLTVISKDAPYSDAAPNSSQGAAVNLFSNYSDATVAPTNTQTKAPEIKTETSESSPKPTTPKQTSTYTAPAYGIRPDLSIRLVDVGTVDNFGNFHSGYSAYENARILVRFHVSNIGDAPTGSWSLNMTLPSKILSERTYSSGIQPSLKPGSSYEFSLAFDSFDPSISNITISAYGASDINSANNILSIPMTLGGYNYNYNNNYYNNYGNYNYNYCNYNYCNYNNYNYGNYYSPKADLVVRILDIGTNNYNYYYNNSTPRAGDRVDVRFEVENSGAVSSGNWNFQATFPSNRNTVYNSPSQASLAPGERRRFTISFDDAKSGDGQVNVFVDNNYTVNEENENNNSDSRSIYVSY